MTSFLMNKLEPGTNIPDKEIDRLVPFSHTTQPQQMHGLGVEVCGDHTA